jgi:hypothetical protein
MSLAAARWRRPLAVVLGAALALALLAALALRVASGRLEAALREALGPRASVEAVSLGWRGVEVRGVRIRGAGRAWPAEDELRAERVQVVPALASLWSPGWHVARIEVEGGYVAVQRSRQGRVRVLPALLDERPGAARAGGAPAPPGPRVTIDRVALRDLRVDVYDASVAPGHGHRIRLEALQADLGPLVLPALDVAIEIDLRARLAGPQRQGTLALAGRVTPATKDAAVKATVRGVDLVALQPYLLKVNEGGVRRGVLDLDLQARVKDQRLNAPGRVTLAGLELAPAPGLLGTFAGVPRAAVLGAIERQGRIEVAFTLEGRLDDPAFSLNENLATRIAGGLAESLGVSVGGVVEGMGGVIKGLFGR